MKTKPPEELVNEPLNRVLILDKNSPLVLRVPDNFKLWMEMNLVISVDYGANTFTVLKNRWGKNSFTMPLNVLGFYLFQPEITDPLELAAEVREKIHKHWYDGIDSMAGFHGRIRSV